MVEHSLHTREVRSSSLLVGTRIPKKGVQTDALFRYRIILPDHLIVRFLVASVVHSPLVDFADAGRVIIPTLPIAKRRNERTIKTATKINANRERLLDGK